MARGIYNGLCLYLYLYLCVLAEEVERGIYNGLYLFLYLAGAPLQWLVNKFTKVARWQGVFTMACQQVYKAGLQS